MRTISATYLARNTREILNRVTNRGETVMVERNRVPIAWIVPPESTMTAAQAIAGLKTTLQPSRATAWLKESRELFNETARDPWE